MKSFYPLTCPVSRAPMKSGSQNRIPALAMFFRNPVAVTHQTFRLQRQKQSVQ
jgi:hypothetical protein